MSGQVLKSDGKRFVTSAGKRLLKGAAACACACASGVPCPSPCAVNPSPGIGCAICWDAANENACTPKFIRVTFAGVSGGICVFTPATGGSQKAPSTINAAYVLTYDEVTAASCRWLADENPGTTVVVSTWIFPNGTCSGSPTGSNAWVFVTAAINGTPGAYRFRATLNTLNGITIFDGDIAFTQGDCATTLTIPNNLTHSGGTGGTATVEFCV